VTEVFDRRDGGQQQLDRPRSGVAAFLGPDPNTFRMVDLCLFAVDGDVSQLAPLG